MKVLNISTDGKRAIISVRVPFLAGLPEIRESLDSAVREVSDLINRLARRARKYRNALKDINEAPDNASAHDLRKIAVVGLSHDMRPGTADDVEELVGNNPIKRVPEQVRALDAWGEPQTTDGGES